MFNFKSRIKRLQKKMQKVGVDAVLLAGIEGVNPNVYYYSGDCAFPTIVLITQNDSFLWSTFQASEVLAYNAYSKVNGFKNYKREVKTELASVKKLGLDSHSDLTAKLLLRKKKEKWKPQDFTKELLTFREIKDEVEKTLIRKAQCITKKAIFDVLEEGVNGLSEQRVAGKFEFKTRELGASPDAFPIIVQFGLASAVFHASTTNQKINSKQAPLLIDCGARFNFYCADFSTTVYEGKNEEVINAMQAVRESQRKAFKFAKIGCSGKEMTSSALEVLREFGFKKFTFADVGLSLGHHVGLEVHDGAATQFNKVKFKKGMVFTNEPGLYFPKKFGVRFEDLVVL